MLDESLFDKYNLKMYYVSWTEICFFKFSKQTIFDFVQYFKLLNENVIDYAKVQSSIVALFIIFPNFSQFLDCTVKSNLISVISFKTQVKA